MRSLKIGNILGISLELHSTFILLFAGLALLLGIFDPAHFASTMLLLFFLFLSVFVHELFHSVVALGKGIGVEKIVLLPIGGLSMTKELPEKPADELLIAVAGPLFNFALVAAILVLVNAFPEIPFPHAFFLGEATPEALEAALMGYPLFALFYVNLILGAFNLFIPALPMDGGRVFRSILSMAMGFQRATVVAAKVSKFFAFLLFLVGLLGGNILLLIIAAFVWMGSNFEKDVALYRELLKDADLRKAVVQAPPAIAAEASLEDAFQVMEDNAVTDLMVIGKKNVGYLSADALSEVSRAQWPVTVAGHVARPLPFASLKTKPQKLVTALLSENNPFIPFLEKGKLVGVITEASLNRLYLLRQLEGQK